MPTFDVDPPAPLSDPSSPAPVADPGDGSCAVEGDGPLHPGATRMLVAGLAALAVAAPADAVAERALLKAVLDESLVSLTEEVGWRLAGLLDEIAHETAANRADGSGQAAAGLRAEAHALAGHLVDLVRIARRRLILVTLPARLTIDVDAAPARVVFSPLTA